MSLPRSPLVDILSLKYTRITWKAKCGYEGCKCKAFAEVDKDQAEIIHPEWFEDELPEGYRWNIIFCRKHFKEFKEKWFAMADNAWGAAQEGKFSKSGGSPFFI